MRKTSALFAVLGCVALVLVTVARRRASVPDAPAPSASNVPVRSHEVARDGAALERPVEVARRAAEASESAPEPGALAATGPSSEEQRWLGQTRSMGPEDLDDLRHDLESEIDEVARPEFEARLAAGRYEVTGHGKEGRMDEWGWDNDFVMTLVIPASADGEVKKVVLPESEFPALYVKRRECNWLIERAHVLRDERIVARRARRR